MILRENKCYLEGKKKKHACNIDRHPIPSKVWTIGQSEDDIHFSMQSKDVPFKNDDMISV